MKICVAVVLMLSHATHLTTEQVKELLIETAVGTTNLTGKCVANGYLSIEDAVYELYQDTRPAYSRGDANGNGLVETVDYMMTRRIILGTFTATADQMQGADANGDGEVTLIDYMMLKRYILKTHYFSPV